MLWTGNYIFCCHAVFQCSRTCVSFSVLREVTQTEYSYNAASDGLSFRIQWQRCALWQSRFWSNQTHLTETRQLRDRGSECSKARTTRSKRCQCQLLRSCGRTIHNEDLANSQISVQLTLWFERGGHWALRQRIFTLAKGV